MASNAGYSHRDPMLKKRDDFEDILEERRTSSDLRYALRCYTPALYKGVTPCHSGLLKSMVLQSDQLTYVIRQISKETGKATADVQEEASAILEEMAHSLQLNTVRFFAFSLCKVFKTLFKSICVNEEGIQRLQQAIQEHPVVLLPSHRSYMDFLLMSYLLFTYDLSLPVIAAGMDFMGMKVIGEMLRMSGAFFIRRSFGGDQLYWTVFSEYVRTMLKIGYAPVEFFLEGTRSRTAKSLTPKLGLLNIAMDPFLKGEVYDVHVVPVSISYERILEETLYARELLGIPKPKESTSGLFKARKVLSEDYGSIHVYFGQPVSVRSLAEGRVNRRQFNLLPRHIPTRPGEDVQSFVSDSAYKLVRLQEENMVLKPWALWLRDVSRQYGAFLHWPDHIPPSEVVSSSLSLHGGLVRLCEGRVHLAVEQAAGPSSPGEALSPVTPEEELLNRAVVLLSCASYRNQALHVFLRPALLASALHTAASTQKHEVFNSFSFLRNIFSNEFILCPGATVQDFEEACFLLVKTGVLQVTQHEVLVTESGHRTLSFLTNMLDPFLQGYQKNSLAALLRLGAVQKIKGADQETLKVDKVMVNSLEDTLGGKLPTQKAVAARL
ncbi:Dihydroxyacetone phosphate acyltransferase [Dissostichus eleginoides]|uniref:Dihydroxyacetone phosphate acyltransferase n=1 Tax=Dissostichus eleginoides TaxID=100907 RepID=A0AAD9BUR0_DISEL|nr:Dihydroxyacetone phosphate acyltransferase [Dissostichus eleginoides]